jgi:hypothetical protein
MELGSDYSVADPQLRDAGEVLHVKVVGPRGLLRMSHRNWRWQRSDPSVLVHSQASAEAVMAIADRVT